MPKPQQFASDNLAGMCPAAARGFQQACAAGHVSAYGDDDWTQQACQRMREVFDTDCDVYFVFNGTAANALALASLCQSHHAIICSDVAHIETDECGAPELFTHGAKLRIAPSAQGVHAGKLSPEAVLALATQRSDLHFPKPKAVSLTQSTELGTVYSVDELRAITEVAKRQQLRVHMDGARFANAVAHLQCHPADISWRAGVDVLCFGGTKNGLPFGEAVVFFDRTLSEDFAYRVKQAGQLASKMRFISAPWLALLQDEAWLHNARHANAMAQRLYMGIHALPGVHTLSAPQSNAVFAHLPEVAKARLRQQGWHFYDFMADGGVRLMCAWDTQAETVDRFVSDLRQALA